MITVMKLIAAFAAIWCFAVYVNRRIETSRVTKARKALDAALIEKEAVELEDLESRVRDTIIKTEEDMQTTKVNA